MADFAASGSTHKPNFTNAERRKIIVKHESLGGRFAGLQKLDPLLIVLGPQGDGNQRLGLAAGE